MAVPIIYLSTRSRVEVADIDFDNGFSISPMKSIFIYRHDGDKARILISQRVMA